MEECPKISDVGLSSACRSLTKLNVSRSTWFFKVTDATLLSLGECCRGLKEVVFAGCDIFVFVVIVFFCEVIQMR